MLAVIAIAALLGAGNAHALYENGIALFQAGRYDESAKTLTEATNLDAKDARIWKALGAAYAAQGQFELAEPPFANACRLDPKLRDACYYLGRNRYATNRYEGSLAALEVALKHEERPVRVHVAIALSLEALGRAAEAEPHFEKAIKLNARALPADRTRADDDPRLAYGTFLFRAGRTEQALRPLTEVIADYPDCAAAHLELGRTLYQLGRYPEAVSHLERAVALDANSSVAHLLLGKALLRTDRANEAERHLERGRSLDPQR